MMNLPSLLNWMVLSAVLLALLWLPYAAALRRERCFSFNRAYLALAPLLAVGLPLLPAPTSLWQLPLPAMRGAGVWLPALKLSAQQPVAPGFSFSMVLAGLYSVGVVWQLGRLAGQLWQLRRQVQQWPRTPSSSYTLVMVSDEFPISSFGRWIFWQQAAGAATTANPLLRHELAHVRRWHTLDRLLLALVQAALWFNPLIYFFGRALEMTHEFQADADAATPVTPAEPAYATLLARYAAAQLGVRQPLGPAFSLTHSFTHSPILTRLAMLKNSLPVRRWKQALVLPALAAGLLIVGCERQNATPTTAEAVANSPLQLLPPPPPAPPASNPVLTAEQQPEYPGGLGQFMTDLSAAIQYPAAAKAQHLQGKLFIGFVVGVDGRIYDATVKKELTPSYQLTTPDGSEHQMTLKNNPTPTPAQAAAARALEAEALRAVQSLPVSWMPGRTAGQPVAVSFTLPVQFTL